METSTRPNYTPVYKDGHRLTIRGMAATSIKNNDYQVSQCDRCHAYVAWARSKAGKWYVCETAQYSTEGGYERFRAVPYKYHECPTADLKLVHYSYETTGRGFGRKGENLCGAVGGLVTADAAKTLGEFVYVTCPKCQEMIDWRAS